MVIKETEPGSHKFLFITTGTACWIDLESTLGVAISRHIFRISTQVYKEKYNQATCTVSEALVTRFVGMEDALI